MKKIKFIGTIFTILAIIIIFYKLFHMDIDFSVFQDRHNLIIFILIMVVYIVQIELLFIPWLLILKIFNINIDKKQASFVYVKSNILKYIPGNIFQYVGRNELAVISGLNHLDVGLSSILEVIVSIIATFIVSMLFAWKYTLFFILKYIKTISIIAVICIFFLICFSIFIHKKHNKNISKYIDRYKELIGIKQAKLLFFSICYYIVNSIVSALTFMVILKVIGGNEFVFAETPILIGAFILSWLMGFIVPGSPGGIGVREFVMITIIQMTSIQSDIVMIAMIVYRVICILGDFIALVISLICNQLLCKKTKN